MEEFVGEGKEGGGDDKTPPDAGGTAEGEAFGEGVVEAITLQIFPQQQNALKHFHHYLPKSVTLKFPIFFFFYFSETYSHQHSRSNI